MFARRIAWSSLIVALAAMPARAVDAKYLPSDTEMVVSINIKQMLDSDVAKTYKDVIDQVKGFLEGTIQTNPGAKYLGKAGFDVFRDLHGVTLASKGGKDLDSGILIIHGSFNVGKIHAAAEDIARENAELLKITKRGGARVFEITPPGEKRIYAALLNDKTLVACGSLDMLQESIERSAGTSRKGLKEGFKALLKTTSDKQSFSFAATGTALGKLIEEAPLPNAELAAGVLSNLDGLSAAITLTKDVQFQLGMNAKDAETAKKAVAAGSFALFTLKMLAEQKAKEDEKLQPLVDIARTLRIVAEGNNVVLRGEVSTENLEKLIKNLPKGLNP
jgi:hypothetical protein